jgi:bacillithiol system protein YtxJ
MGRTSTLPERLFPLVDPAAVDAFLDGFTPCAVFKAASGEKTFEAWLLVQKALEPRVDVAAGLIRIPADRPASDHVAARTGIAHKSPQFILFEGGRPRAHLDERAIQPERLGEVLAEHLPPSPGPRVVNPAVVSLDRYRGLLEDFVASRLPEDRFQWDYLDRLAKEASWRDDQAFALLTSVFDGTWDRDFKPARVIAHEFQGKIAGRVTPLRERAERLLKQITS